MHCSTWCTVVNCSIVYVQYDRDTGGDKRRCEMERDRVAMRDTWWDNIKSSAIERDNFKKSWKNRMLRGEKEYGNGGKGGMTGGEGVFMEWK